MTVLKATNSVSALDVINMTGSDPFSAIPDEGVKVRAAAIVEDDDKEFAYIFGDGDVKYGGNSESIRKSVSSLIDIFDQLDHAPIASVKSGTSKGGKTFLTMSFR